MNSWEDFQVGAATELGSHTFTAEEIALTLAGWVLVRRRQA